jgi:hypothetical protein
LEQTLLDRASQNLNHKANPAEPISFDLGNAFNHVVKKPEKAAWSIFAIDAKKAKMQANRRR